MESQEVSGWHAALLFALSPSPLPSLGVNITFAGWAKSPVRQCRLEEGSERIYSPAAAARGQTRASPCIRSRSPWAAYESGADLGRRSLKTQGRRLTLTHPGANNTGGQRADGYPIHVAEGLEMGALPA